MNEGHLKIISEQFQFRVTSGSVQKLSGGPGGGHLCWKIRSDKGSFFVKQLDPTFDANDEKIITRYELCESVAVRFAQQSIPAVHAVKNGNKFVVVVENSIYLIYPWIDGHTLSANEISTDHVVRIVEILAKIHTLNLPVPELEPKFDIHSNEEIISIIEKTFALKSVSALLKNNQKMIFKYEQPLPFCYSYSQRKNCCHARRCFSS